MTLEVLNLIYLIHRVLFKEEGSNKIAFKTVYCTRFTYVDNCLNLPIVTVFRSNETFRYVSALFITNKTKQIKTLYVCLQTNKFYV